MSRNLNYSRSVANTSSLQENVDTINDDISTATTIANAALPSTGGTITGNISTTNTITSTATAGIISKKYTADEGTLENTPYSFNGFPNTGMYHDITGGERLLFGIGGNRRIFMSRDGGIGFTTGAANGTSIFTMFPDSVMTYKNFTPSGLNIGLGTSDLKWDSIWARTATISTSDARNKRDILDLTLGLNFIEKLKPVSYVWNDDEVYDEETQTTNTITHSRRHLGLLAQEVHSAITDCGEDLNSTDILSNEFLINPDAKDQYGVRYEMFIPCLIKAIKELTALNSSLEARIEVLEGY
jgi:hypothetical protein